MADVVYLQNGVRVKNRSLPECTKCFFFATDSRRSIASKIFLNILNSENIGLIRNFSENIELLQKV